MAADRTVEGQGVPVVMDILTNRRDEIVNLWIKDRLESGEFRDELITKRELRRQSEQIVEMLARSMRESGNADFDSASYDEMRVFLNEISRARAIKGYTPLENATYILSLRDTIMALLAEELSSDPEAMIREMTLFTRLLDKMGL